jgi:hypothetical protein
LAFQFGRGFESRGWSVMRPGGIASCVVPLCPPQPRGRLCARLSSTGVCCAGRPALCTVRGLRSKSLSGQGRHVCTLAMPGTVVDRHFWSSSWGWQGRAAESSRKPCGHMEGFPAPSPNEPLNVQVLLCCCTPIVCCCTPNRQSIQRKSWPVTPGRQWRWVPATRAPCGVRSCDFTPP